ncbi:MAG: antitoxin [Gammaproteobacteria bacterium]|nr:antitoxin [Gammaproteobacteria bacterium]MYG13043.1 antitoxin [Gammaproteobacteria bacterium]MYH14112.1 antitoxin [Gammaproteobacteria bacterium]MYK27261.1 antitoxin [Gammaproteobacteria bacterium]MYK81073.1 antitoxin [Gammaproteobacteria bacterium]
MKLSISLKPEEVGFLDAYATSQGIASRSAVVQVAVRLLRERQLGGDYAAAFNEIDDETADFWEQTSGDGLSA